MAQPNNRTMRCIGAIMRICTALAVLVGGTLAWAQNTDTTARKLEQPAETWTNFAQDNHTSASKTINAIFMRSSQNTAGKAINIFINGEYFTSLLPGGYKQTLVCQGRNYIGVAEADSDARYNVKKRPSYTFDLQGDEMRYFQVMVNAQGKAEAIALSSKQAKQQMRGLKKQNHSVPRIEKNRRCMPQKPEPKPDPQS